ncbi:SH3 domain containing ring finger posh isoform 2-T3 [Cochliomyia hominivorax]
MDEHTLNDLLECSVCLERLDTCSKVLPCQHTFCRKCLEVIYASRQELRCPECRILVDTKIEDLPPNVLLMRILEGMKNAAIKQHSIINEITKDTNDRNDTIRYSTSGGSIAASSSNTASVLNANVASEERIRQQIQQQQLKQRQQQILQFQQQIQQQHHTYSSPQQQQQLVASATTHQQQQTILQQQQQQSQNQQRRCIVPHAYALYDFESNEPNDLKFKKGDLIFLKRKIDSNWYVGQLKGAEGNFPINYVQVVVPLPTSQCVALYDFKMGPNEEEGCLAFKKGTVIQVLRRVDHNWAEGRIGSSIGIFPIAFVELNQLAKQLLEGFVLSSTSSATQPLPSTHLGVQTTNNDVRNLPPLPPAIDSTISMNNGDSTTSSSSSVSLSANTNTASSSSNSSTTTSPTTASANLTTSSNTVSFHSMPNSPQSSKPTTPQHSTQTSTVVNTSNSVRMRNNDLKHKRHSLNALLNNGGTALSIMQTNRHSAEILSVPNDFDTNEPSSSSTHSTTAAGQTTVAREQQIHTSNLPSAPRHNVLKTCVQQNMPPSLPWGYLALYPYKPRKADELELKKGCVYMVTERCLDGWFKGKNWKDISGVFPGNYVTPLRARDQQQLMHSWKLVPPSLNYQSQSTSPSQNQTPPSISTSGNYNTASQQLSPSYPSSMRSDLENINARLTLANLTPHQAMPPDLPPRYLAISPTPTTVTNSSNNTTMTAKENRDKEAQKEKPTTTGCISTSSSSSSSATSSASAGLKKFLTHIKSRSKSPSAAVSAAASVASIQANAVTQTHSNAAQEQPQQQTIKPNSQNMQSQNIASSSALTPVHVRSGSCPSQLLQNLPNELNHNNLSENKIPSSTASTVKSQQSSPQNNFGSHRIKGPKERASLENSRPTIDSTLRSIYANHIQQQSALMANKCSQQYQQQHQSTITNLNSTVNNTNTAIHHRKSHSLDASNILQSHPIAATASSFSNNGISVAGSAIKATAPQCNINAAAIHASATTKSTQNMSESRFRCVVPYPPNSDVELELQVGDIIFVYRKQKNGWYKGTNSRTYKTGLFPASFVEPDI